ncbi:MAG: hypothetical protein Q9213_003156 [Squamulea squamosa]
MVIWAHYILGLTVVIKDSPDGDVTFGRMVNPQLMIKWSSTFVPSKDFNFEDFTSLSDINWKWAYPPPIYLLDADINVLLKIEPDDSEGTRIEGQETHRLQGYGTAFLRRMLNWKILVEDDDPIFTDAANFASSFAFMSARMIRRALSPPRGFDVRQENLYMSPSYWRLWESSCLLLWGIKLDKRIVTEFINKLSGQNLKDMSMPASIRNYLQRNNEIAYEELKADFLFHIKIIASWILAFAHVVNVESCSGLPLRISHVLQHPVVNMQSVELSMWQGVEPLHIQPDTWFYLIRKLMRKNPILDYNLQTDIPPGVFLTCHQGWSLFINSVGDHDPGNIACELLHIMPGVPTNTRTGERRYRMSDAPTVMRGIRAPEVVDDKDSYIPRCVTKVLRRSEYYTTRSDEFWLAIRFDIEDLEPASQIKDIKNMQDQRYTLYASYAHFHETMWGVVMTRPCSHGDEGSEPLPLDLDTKAVRGLTWAHGDGDATETRICILLVKGDTRSRWLAVHGIKYGDDVPFAEYRFRQTVLRCEGCCADCAVRTASELQGFWLVIL